jgi:hypothetical protein
MSKQTLLIISTLEAGLFTNLYAGINTPDMITKIENFYNGGTVQTYLSVLAHGNYPAQFSAAFSSGNYGPLFEYFEATPGAMDTFAQLSNEVFDAVFANFDTTVFETTTLIPFSILSAKPAWADKLIAWRVNDSDVDYAHLTSHEQISLDQAKQLVALSNAWLEANKDKFDIYFDGTSPADILTALKAL